MKYKAIAFDLDDTLIDTTNQLIPFACRKIHTHLLSLGYTKSFEEFDGLRKDFVKTRSHKEFFRNLAPTLAKDQKSDHLFATLNQLFYEPEIPSHLTLMDGAEDNLERLIANYDVFIVTAGVIKAQERKLAQLKINRFIQADNILVVAENGIATKKLAFEKILQKAQIQPHELLSVGNRLSQEIRMTKQLGGHTCYFQFGEHADDVPQDQFEIPDYTIHTHKELISACHL